MEQFFTRFAIRIAATLVVGAILASQGGRFFGGPAATPTPVPPVHATSRPVAVQSTVPPTPAATADARLEALWTRISDPAVSYHLSGSGVNKQNGSVFERFTMELDISGDDYRGRVNSIGGSGKSQLVRLDGTMYMRAAGRPWTSAYVPRDDVLQFTPFLNIDSTADLSADGVVTRGGQQLFRYVSTSSYQPSVAHMMDLSLFTSRCDVLTLALLVTGDAVPVSAHFECQAATAAYSGVSDYEFSQFGKSFAITAPIK